MTLESSLLAVTILVTLGALLPLVVRPALTATTGGKILAFFALFLLPALMVAGGLSRHLETSKSTDFCLSCHVMEPYGTSLRYEDTDYLPAIHFQNNLLPPDQACYTCHTTYAMFGDLKAKLAGVQHLMVNYFGTVPEKIELYAPYQNRECLHCHGGARTFEEGEDHADFRAELTSGETSCLECHDLVHGVEEAGDLSLWSGVDG